MPTVKIQQKAGQVDVDVIIEKDLTDAAWHRLEVISNDDFKWDAPVKVDMANFDNCGVTALGPDSNEIIVKWDNQIIKQEALTISGSGPIISAKFNVQ
ncbi:MAG: hypothetical protein Q7J73_09260 [Dehalococcoidales bacterium]|nr:hypothetical protein [Dehalococcoidales bacterium]